MTIKNDEGVDNLRLAICLQAASDYKRLLLGSVIDDEGVSTYEIEYFLGNSPWFTMLMNCDGNKILEIVRIQAAGEKMLRDITKECKKIQVNEFLNNAKSNKAKIVEKSKGAVVLFKMNYRYVYDKKIHYTDSLYTLWKNGKCIKISREDENITREYYKLIKKK